MLKVLLVVIFMFLVFIAVENYKTEEQFNTLIEKIEQQETDLNYLRTKSYKICKQIKC